MPGGNPAFAAAAEVRGYLSESCSHHGRYRPRTAPFVTGIRWTRIGMIDEQLCSLLWMSALVTRHLNSSILVFTCGELNVMLICADVCIHVSIQKPPRMLACCRLLLQGREVQQSSL